MNGVTMDELYEWITHLHEAEFEYNDTEYVLQPEVRDNKTYLVIWDCTPDTGKIIAKERINDHGDIPKEIIDSILSQKCFNGKSFIDIEKDITVTYIL